MVEKAVPERYERRLPSHGIRVQSEAAEVLDGQPCGTGEELNPAPRHHKHVLDDLVWRADLAVAVMPGELRQLQQVEGRISGRAEVGLHTGAALLNDLQGPVCVPSPGVSRVAGRPPLAEAAGRVRPADNLWRSTRPLASLVATRRGDVSEGELRWRAGFLGTILVLPTTREVRIRVTDVDLDALREGTARDALSGLNPGTVSFVIHTSEASLRCACFPPALETMLRVLGYLLTK